MVDEAGLEAAVLENVRRYRAIASLCRQTAAFRPVQKLSLLQQAEDWEYLAARELEIRCEVEEGVEECSDEIGSDEILPPPVETQVDTRWWLPRREGLFAGLQA
jgi:hypothetical protein